VQPGDYRYAVAFLKKKRKKEALVGAELAEEIMNNWPWDDIDEEKYM